VRKAEEEEAEKMRKNLEELGANKGQKPGKKRGQPNGNVLPS
jgi:hypothetical protein